MKKEKYQKWTPQENIPATLYLDGLYDDWEGFRLLLTDHETDRTLRIIFDPALSYRNTDEGDLLKTEDVGEGFFNWPLYTVKNSRYLKWFHEESLNIHNKENLIHYFIITPNDCIDVISAFPPSVEWLLKKKPKQ